MKIKSLFAAGLLGLIISGPANALFIDLGGVQVDGAALNSFAINNPNANAVVDVTFDFIYETGGDTFGNASWGSELILEVFHVDSGTAGQIGTQAVSCADFGLVCEYDLNWDDTSGIFTATGGFSFMTPITDGSGDWIVTVADSFDDLGIDGQFMDGSYVSINQVPAPAPLALLGLGLVGMSLIRRRQKKA